MVNTNASEVDANQSHSTENEQSILINNQPLATPQSRLNVDPKAELKAAISFRKLMESDGHTFKQSGNSYKCCCPFHPDNTPSFSILPSDDYAKCFGCNWSGDIFNYAQQAYGVDFPTAIGKLEVGLKAPALARRPSVPVHKAIITRKLSEKHQLERRRYIERMQNDPWIRDCVVQERAGGGHKWNPDTIKRLAEEGSLGWAVDALAFLYNTGTKYRRWPHKDFYWDPCSIGNSLWREERVKSAKNIYLTEGETDAITLIDVGLETENTSVVSVPGAGSFAPSWAPMFEGKNVTVCFDSDDAGREGTEKTARALHGVAGRVMTIDLGEVL